MAASIASLQKHFSSYNRTKEFQAHSSKVHSVNWNCDGRRLASGSFDKTIAILLLDRDRLAKDHSFKDHHDSVDQLCWHPSHPDLLATASLDKTVRFFDVRVKKCVSTVETKGDNINICWSPDGQTIAVGNKDDLISFIDTKSHKIKHDEQFKHEVNEITWNNTGDLFFTTTGQGMINIFDYPDMKLIYSLPAHTGNCICIKFDPTGKYFAVGAADAIVSLWDAENLVCVRCIPRLEWPVRTLSFSYDGEMLASSSEDLIIDIAHVDSGERITKVDCETPTFSVAWHPKSYLIAYACDDKDKYERERDAGTVKLWGLPTQD